ncbi:MAG: hypothetical protein HeimC3_21420 [Candidatus Heimdallarchaeota archaeon LC_3]|nr:MAG: hypothetical protein HeimC3_21420 [Candidatus Heimdallarchaeota archaeon LC_3]
MSYVSLFSNSKLVQTVPNLKFSDEEVIKLFKTIAHPLRLNILRFLLINKEICTLELENLFNSYFEKYPPYYLSEDSDSYSVAQPAITRQLTIMKKENILKNRRISFVKNEKTGRHEKVVSETGKWNYYRINEEKLPLIKHMMQPFINESFQEIQFEKEDIVLDVD